MTRRSPPIAARSADNLSPAKIRAVLDTNVVVSAVLTSGGAEAYTLDLAAVRKIQIFATTAILAEYEGVLRRPKFSRISPQLINGALDLIRHVAILVKPTEILAVSADESDNRFLECAEAADADYLVTGNKRHFPARWKRTAVIGARELVELRVDAERSE
ncbi:MAG: putative toxin-antitoxin system toxin component, PIN family [Bryobacteraceae bacterium]